MNSFSTATPVRLVALSGSLRRGSFNGALLALAVAEAERAGAQPTVIPPLDLELPVYSQEREGSAGLPASVVRFKAAVAASDGLLIASPEHNMGLPAALKNLLDWASRSGDNRPDLAPFSGKVAALLGASPGPYGALRAQGQLRTVLESLGVLVLPEGLAIPRAASAFAERGELVDERQAKRLAAVVARLVEVASRLRTTA